MLKDQFREKYLVLYRSVQKINVIYVKKLRLKKLTNFAPPLLTPYKQQVLF